MPGDTTRYSWPYQSLGDAPDGAALGASLATAVEATVGSIDDRVDALEDETVKPRGVTRWGNRPTNRSCTTAETTILRIDNITLVSGRAYRLAASGCRGDTDTATGRFKFVLRLSTAGVATTGSGLVRRAEGGDTDSAHLERYYVSAVNTTTASLLLTGTAVGGAASVNVLGSDEGGIDLYVEDLGLAQADTGVDL